MDENKVSKYCTPLLIDDDNHNKIYVSEKNKYYIEHGNNEPENINLNLIYLILKSIAQFY